MGLLTFLIGVAVGISTIYFFREPDRITIDPIVVETDDGPEREARPTKRPGRGAKRPPERKRPSRPRSDDSGGGAVPVPPAPPPAGGGDDDDDEAGDDDDDDGTDD